MIKTGLSSWGVAAALLHNVPVKYILYISKKKKTLLYGQIYGYLTKRISDCGKLIALVWQANHLRIKIFKNP